MAAQFLDFLFRHANLRPRTSPHPCVGEYIGSINRINHCWEAIGEYRNYYDFDIKDKIVKYLDGWSALSISSEDYYHLEFYMIGKSEQTASPTVCIISKNSRYRKEARAAIKRTDLLRKYPKFKTAHMREDPGWGGPLVQLASSRATNTVIDDPVPAKEVFYDNSKKLNPWGMTIYIRHGSTPRIATAHAIRLRGRQYFLSASHAFFQNSMRQKLPPIEFIDDEFEIDSDNEDDIEDQGSSTTSIHSSNSGDHFIDDVCSGESEMSVAPSAVFSKASSALPPNPTKQVYKELRSQATSSAEGTLEKAKKPKPESIVRLGTLIAWSIDQDWALIEPVQDVDPYNMDKTLPDSFKQELAMIPKHVRTVFTHTSSRGRMIGITSFIQSWIRVPGATTFQPVYSVRFNGTLANGDCGSGVFEMPTGSGVKLVGHIIAGCQSSGFAYVMAAQSVLIRLEDSLDQLGFHPNGDGLPAWRLPSVFMDDLIGSGPSLHIDMESVGTDASTRWSPSIHTIQEVYDEPGFTVSKKAKVYSKRRTEHYNPMRRALHMFHYN